MPEGYTYRLPAPQESDIRRVSNGTVVFKAAIELGLRFPISNFGASFLKTHGISPGQLHPHAWMQLVAFTVHCRLRGVIPSLPLLGVFFRLRGSTGLVPYSLQRVYQPGFENRLFEKPANKLHDFETEWLVVEFP